jgi:ABC-2 type transport system ATP-binding protein
MPIFINIFLVKSKIRTLIKELNIRKNTTVILTTHDIGDIEALSQRAIIIDKGKIIFDDEYEKLKYIFGSYRTLRVNMENNKGKIIAALDDKFGSSNSNSLSASIDEENWVNITVNQDKISIADVLNYVMNNYKVYDVKIEEIQAENIIKKIYNDGIKAISKK